MENVRAPRSRGKGASERAGPLEPPLVCSVSKSSRRASCFPSSSLTQPFESLQAQTSKPRQLICPLAQVASLPGQRNAKLPFVPPQLADRSGCPSIAPSTMARVKQVSRRKVSLVEDVLGRQKASKSDSSEFSGH